MDFRALERRSGSRISGAALGCIVKDAGKDCAGEVRGRTSWNGTREYPALVADGLERCRPAGPPPPAAERPGDRGAEREAREELVLLGLCGGQLGPQHAVGKKLACVTPKSPSPRLVATSPSAKVQVVSPGRGPREYPSIEDIPEVQLVRAFSEAFPSEPSRAPRRAPRAGSWRSPFYWPSNRKAWRRGCSSARAADRLAKRSLRAASPQGPVRPSGRPASRSPKRRREPQDWLALALVPGSPRHPRRLKRRRLARLAHFPVPQPTLAEFYAFVADRERLRRERAACPGGRPWTNDRILHNFRFTNVKRSHDRTTQVVGRVLQSQVEHWEQCKSYEARKDCAAAHVLNIALWRRFGSAAFVERIGFRPCPKSPEDFARWEDETIEVAHGLWREGFAACTDAYFPARCVHNSELRAWSEASLARGGPRPQGRADRDALEAMRRALRPRPLQGSEALDGEARVKAAYTKLCRQRWPLRRLWEALPDIAEAMGLREGAGERSWRAVVQRLMAVDGFGGTGFSAKEVVLDLLLTPLMARCADLDTWCPVGPGACRGLNRLAGRPLQAMPASEQLLEELLRVFHVWKEHYPASLAEETPLGLHDVQFQLCEFDKYLRGKHGQGRLRRFVPFDDPDPPCSKGDEAHC